MGEWRETTLGELAIATGGDIQTGPFGSQLHASDYVSDGTPSVMPQNIGDNRINPADIARVAAEDIARLSRYVLRTGDIVYSRRGDVERRALVRDENDGWLCGTGCLRVRFGDNSEVDPAFVAYALGLRETRKWIVRHAVGATMLNLNSSILGNVPLRMPEPAVQESVSAVLGAIDDKIAANERARRVAANLARSVFVRAVFGAQRYSTLRELEQNDQIEFGDGYRTKKSEHADDGYAIVRAADVRDGAVTTDGTDHVSRAFSRQIGSKSVRVNDLVMTTKGTVGRTAIVGELTQDAVYSPQCCYFRVPDSSEVQWGYLAGWFLSDLPQRQLDSLMHKSDMAPYVNLRDVGTLEIPRLLADQERDVGEEQQTLIALMQKCAASNRVLAHTRDELLPLLMSGKLTVKDAETAVADL